MSHFVSRNVYGSKCLTIKKSEENNLLIFERKIPRKIFGAIKENNIQLRKCYSKLESNVGELWQQMVLDGRNIYASFTLWSINQNCSVGDVGTIAQGLHPKTGPINEPSALMTLLSTLHFSNAC